MADFKDMLKFYRKRENISQAELARCLSLSPSTISMYEVGEREPSFEVEEKIADFFNVDLNTLRGKGSEDIYSSLGLQARRILELFESLNESGKNRLIAYAEDLSEMQKYKS